MAERSLNELPVGKLRYRNFLKTGPGNAYNNSTNKNKTNTCQIQEDHS
jgi:hypothetical protein